MQNMRSGRVEPEEPLLDPQSRELRVPNVRLPQVTAGQPEVAHKTETPRDTNTSEIRRPRRADLNHFPPCFPSVSTRGLQEFPGFGGRRSWNIHG